ncbi:MAG: hypothetical protein WBB32_02690 [Flavobacteriales bacterium]|nr:hypothetical protein [Flavobacteriales bacterium]
MKHIIPILSVLLILALPAASQAQCRSFAKNKCMPSMAPYKFNETFNAAQLAPGEEAEVDLTFYSGQEYRLLVCAHPILGNVNWQLADAAGNVLFKSTADEPKEHFDFKVATTQKLTVHIDVPAGEKGGTNMLTVGCVGILVGYKE